MPFIWTTLLKVALNMAVVAIGKVPASDWAKLSTILTDWLQKLAGNLPAGSPAFSILSSYRAPRSMMIAPNAPKPSTDTDLWSN